VHGQITAQMVGSNTNIRNFSPSEIGRDAQATSFISIRAGRLCGGPEMPMTMVEFDLHGYYPVDIDAGLLNRCPTSLGNGSRGTCPHSRARAKPGY